MCQVDITENGCGGVSKSIKSIIDNLGGVRSITRTSGIEPVIETILDAADQRNKKEIEDDRRTTTLD